MNRIHKIPFFILLFFLYFPVAAQNQKVTVKRVPSENKVNIFIGGKPFTTYLFPDTLEKPILYPIHAANGSVVTRGFPIHPQPGEPTDHPHQVGMWFNYENVNGLDFWNNSYAIPKDQKSHYGWIRQQKILKTHSGDSGLLKVAAHWENKEGKALLKEKTTFKFRGDKHRRIIDRTTKLTATVPVAFKDVKDGLLGLRVAKGLQMPNGNYLTSTGKTGDSAWGTRARWCMLYGKLDGEMTSITIFDHPGNPGYPTYWHARGYGLFAANPLGEEVFSKGKQKMNLHLKPGQSVEFRYRIIIHTGKLPSVQELNGEADDYAGNSLHLWYNKPASNWNEALPIGNGRLAAMVFGGIDSDRVQLNEGTIWAGEPGNNVPKQVYDSIQKMRKLLFEGENLKAQQLSERTYPRHAPPDNNYGMPYQTAGSLNIDFKNQENPSHYKRDLDISKAVSSVSYTSNGIRYKREYFASIPDNVIMIRLTADKPGSITCDLHLNTPYKKYSLETRKGKLILSGKTSSVDNKEGKVKYEVQAYPKIEGGEVTETDSSLKIQNADAATIYVSIATNVINYKDISGNESKKATKYLKKAVKKDFKKARQEHIATYKKYFNRVSLRLGKKDSIKDQPTNLRVKEYPENHDPDLAALYFQFGRYLLISGSFPGSQATNLQGKWNASLNPPWDSKYTVNINTEMNYWPSEITALPEMHQPLFDMLEDLSKTGKESTSKMYHARGWNMHHNTDLWRITGVVDGGYYGIWPMGGAWLSQQIWQHYLYTGDKKFLKKYYPVLKGAALFYVDVLQEEPKHHWLVVSPSMSPEHSYGHKDGVSLDIAYGTTMDNQLVFDLFYRTIKAAKVLDKDRQLMDTMRMKKDKLPPMHIGQYGQLQEWLKDLDKKGDHHRHVSHLYGLFPSNQLSPYRTPKLFQAAKKSLIMRGDVSTGWSMSWKINLWAQLLDGNHAMKLLKDQIKPPGESGGGSYPNLFDAHPPFQIDGNFGVTSGIARMLLQSDDGDVFILPALPDVWQTGEVKGLRTRGGFIVDMKWEEGKITQVTIHSTEGGNCRIRTYTPLKASGNTQLSIASGKNSNPFFATPQVKKPIISDKAQLKKLDLKPTYLYDLKTKKGETYILKQSNKK